MNFLLSISLVTHLTQLRSVPSFLVMLKWKGGACVEGDTQGRRGGAGGAWAALPRCSIPGTNKGAKPEEMGGRKGQAAGQLLGFSGWDFLSFIFCFCTQPGEKCNLKKKKGQENMHISVYLCTLSEECLHLALPLPIPFSREWGGLEN